MARWVSRHALDSRGFTYIELLTSVGIVVFLSAVVIASQQVGSRIESLQRSTNSVAVDIRRAQNMALAASSEAGTAAAYGVYFPNSPGRTYALFRDADGDQTFDGNISPCSGECLETRDLERRIQFSGFTAGSASPSASPPPSAGTASQLTFLFCPPYALALLYGQETSRGTDCIGNQNTLRRSAIVSLTIEGATPSTFALRHVRLFASGTTEVLNQRTFTAKTPTFSPPPRFALPSTITPPPPPPGAPLPPTGLTCAPGNQQVTLSWTASSGATSYTLYMATRSGVTKTNFSTLSGGMSHFSATSPYIHTGLLNGTTYSFVVTASNTDGDSLESAQASCTPSTIPLSFSAKINFQPSSSTLPPGYLLDDGAVYNNRGNGYTYGWNSDNTANARDRNIHPDQRYDTLNHMQKPACVCFWELLVPNGTYQVKIVAGDPSFLDSIYKINVENTLAIDGTPASATKFFEKTVTVTVSDDKLTVSNATGSSNNKINFIEVASL